MNWENNTKSFSTIRSKIYWILNLHSQQQWYSIIMSQPQITEMYNNDSWTSLNMNVYKISLSSSLSSGASSGPPPFRALSNWLSWARARKCWERQKCTSIYSSFPNLLWNWAFHRLRFFVIAIFMSKRLCVLLPENSWILNIV